MSSPAGLQYSQTDFLARWMPSSTRAGVILSPCPAVAAPVGRPTCLASPGPDDSFASLFAPLPASADSSCVAVEENLGAESAQSPGAEMEINKVGFEQQRDADEEMESLEETAAQSHDLSLMMKLEQLRKWQQHMQEQLKAHQLEELLRLQEEQQRLLAMMNTQHQHTARNLEELSGPDWGEDTLHSTTHCQLQPTAEQQEGPQQVLRGPSAEATVPEEEGEAAGMCSSRNDKQTQRDSISMISDQIQVHQDHSTQEETPLMDRPIKPGIRGQKQTFEEMLAEQLILEEQRLKSVQQQQQRDPGSDVPHTRTKRSFLKRGEGLLRFTNRKAATERQKEPKPQPQAKAIIRSSSEPASLQKTQTNPFQKLPVQRKTAILSKEHRPTSSLPQNTKTACLKVLQSHLRLHTPESDTVQSSSEEKHSRQTVEPTAVRTPSVGNILSRQVGLVHNNRTEDERSANPGAPSTQGQRGAQDSLELSFQERLQRWECDRRLESMELGEFELLEQAAEELSFSSNSSFVVKVLQMDRQRQPPAAALHQRRLSSTPIKSPPDPQQRCSQGTNPGSHMGGTEVGPDQDNKQGQCGSSWDESENEEHHTEEQVPSVPSVYKFPFQSNPPYDKRSYQDEDSCRDLSLNRSQSEDADTDSEDCTVTEENPGRVVFDDDDTWNQLEESVALSHDSSFRTASRGEQASPPEHAVTRKVAETKAVELEKQQDLPPPSQLMSRLFPALKTKSQNAPVSCLSAAGEPRTAPQATDSQQAQSQLLRERLVELEIEIEHFKKENAALTKLRKDNEKVQEDLRKERSEFEQMKDQELARFEEYKREETRKLQRERKLFEKHMSAARAIPNKNEREEIQALRQQLSSLQEELRKKESRWTNTHSRLRQQLEALGQDNSALREEVKTLEKLRITSWKKNSTDSEKDKISGAKGVKFATPLDCSSCSPQSSLTAPATRGSHRDSASGGAAVTGMKSSLRRPSLPGRRTEETEPGTQSLGQSNSSPEQAKGCSPGETHSEPHPAENSEQKLELPQEAVTCPDGKVEKVLPSGERLIVFPNGTKKEVSADGMTVKVTFFNGDTKELTADQRVIYFYADAKTTHITYPDGMEVLHFPNNQTEKHFPDGRKEITFPDQTVKNLYPNGREESVLTDGTIIQVHPDGSKEIHFNTGQREVHTAEYKRREYPDGTVKTVYSDGRQETRYPTGRVRIKDKEGNIILDNRT